MGAAGQGGEEILEYGARVVAELTDIEGIPLEVSIGAGTAPPSREDIVEGHIVFHTMDIVPPTPLEMEELNVVGFVECRWNVTGIKLPFGGIDRIFVECNTGGSIFFSDASVAPPTSRRDLAPTGWSRIVAAPDPRAAPALVTEYEYWTHRVREDGALEAVKAYCWETSLLAPGVNPETGKRYNFVGAIPLEQADEMGLERVRVQLGSEFFRISY